MFELATITTFPSYDRSRGRPKDAGASGDEGGWLGVWEEGGLGVGKASEPGLAALAGEWQSFLLPVTEVASCLPLIFSYNTVSYTVHYIKLYTTIIYFHHHLKVRSRASYCRNPDGKQPALDTQPTISEYFRNI